MKPDKLLARLKHDASVFVAEERRFPDGRVEYILGTHLSFFPLRASNRWYVLAIEPGQETVEEEEIEAILRRFWHGEIDIKTWLEQPPTN